MKMKILLNIKQQFPLEWLLTDCEKLRQELIQNNRIARNKEVCILHKDKKVGQECYSFIASKIFNQVPMNLIYHKNY